MFPDSSDANLDRIVGQARLRSSFIYLANAVNDLSGDWVVLGLILAPLILLASLCLLPDALNLQHRLAHSFEAGNAQPVSAVVHDIALRRVQTPYRPEAAPRPAPDLYPWWMTDCLHLLFLLITLLVNLVVLCELARKEAGARAPAAASEAFEVYKRAVRTAPAFLWIVLLQFLVFAVAAIIFLIPLLSFYALLYSHSIVQQDYHIVIPLVLPGLLVLVFLYFAQYALVFSEIHSWPALLYSRELMRGRFMKVATRIVVFLAVWSGYNSWASGAFIVASIFLGPVAVVTGFVWGMVFILDAISVGVAYFTIAFFMAAGGRLYQDLSAFAREKAVAANGAAMEQTAPLAGAAAPIS